MLAPSFVKQMQSILGDEYQSFRKALAKDAPVSIRLNPFKPWDNTEGIGENPLIEGVPWHPHGYYLQNRPVFTLDPLWHAGAYYVQEASSMFLHFALDSILPPEREGVRILDMCASPGGKSTLLSEFTGSTGLLVSNEYVRSRVNPLRENIERWGPLSTGVLSADANAFDNLESWFDVVVTDAPCSGEGLFRKDKDSVLEWSLPHVESCAIRQKRILPGALSAIKPGGYLVYSTCTYNHQENERIVQWLCEEHGMEIVHIRIPPQWNIVEHTEGYRFFPHRTKGEGFFLAILKKSHGLNVRNNPASGFQHLRPLKKSIAESLKPWVTEPEQIKYYMTPKDDIIALPATHLKELLVLDKVGSSKWFGTKMGTLKGKDFIPDHALALSNFINSEIPSLNLDLEQALLFLKKETFRLPPGSPQGWLLMKYKELNLGWIKAMPNRMNNYLPAERRIRMKVPVRTG